MKKTIIMILLLLILISVLVGCSKNSKTTGQHISVGIYVMQESEEPLKPSVSLEEHNQFSFNYSALSSYIPKGTYEVDNGILTLKTDDGKYKYLFKIKDNTLIFNATKSSEIPSFANIADGSIFK